MRKFSSYRLRHAIFTVCMSALLPAHALRPGAHTFERANNGLQSYLPLSGTRNAALYTGLAPVTYSFQSESPYDGVNWSPSSEVYALSVPPALSQRLSVWSCSRAGTSPSCIRHSRGHNRAPLVTKQQREL